MKRAGVQRAWACTYAVCAPSALRVLHPLALQASCLEAAFLGPGESWGVLRCIGGRITAIEAVVVLGTEY